MRRKLAAVVVTAAVSTLVLAGCSSSSTSSGSSPTPAPTSASASPTAAGTIVEVASAAADFSTLVAAVKAAGLVDTLNGAGPYTVFAPTNEAFAALPAGVLDKLLLPENKDVLTKILTYHVVAGEVMAADVKPGAVKTVEGQDITITVDNGTVKVNDATVTATDIDASNGVIHVIDGVLLPPGVDPAAL